MIAAHPLNEVSGPVGSAAPAKKWDVLQRLVEDPTIRTPTFVCFEAQLLENCRNLKCLARAVGAKALYSLKALSLPELLPSMAESLDGFSVSSLFEARLARDCGGKAASVHLTTPALRPDEVDPLGELCDFISMNSLTELQRYGNALGPRVQLGLRINPGLSFVDDRRYDPCAPQSRLGVPLDSLHSFAERHPRLVRAIRGLHFHTNCESENFDQLHETTARIVPLLTQLGAGISWVNLGGGYYLPDDGVPRGLRAAIDLIRGGRPELDVYLEPGTGVAQDAAVMLTTVLDVIERDPVAIVVLDTTVNHLPEVLEYQYSPDAYRADNAGRYRYTLTGRSCLAGDVFGEYSFGHPLEVGQRICFLDVGSYSLVKTNMFNGIPAPLLCHIRSDGSRHTIEAPTYEKWLGSYGAAGL